MPICFYENERIFKLDTSESSYIFGIYEDGFLVHYYYGAKIPDYNVAEFKYRGGFASVSPTKEYIKDNRFSLDIAPMEYACNSTGDYRIDALSIKNSDGNTATDIRYVSHKIFKGKKGLNGLPSLYANDDGEVTTLEVETIDKVTGAKVTLVYCVFEKLCAMTRSVRVENTSNSAFTIEKIMSCDVDFSGMNYNMYHLYGTWAKERTLAKRHLEHGIQSIQSKRGTSSHNHNPFLALADDFATEDFGSAYGFNLVYSGNFSAEVEVDAYETSRVNIGINPNDFEWELKPNEEFTSPEVVMVFSNNGLGGMSRTFHKLYMNNLIRSKWKNVKRPLLINSWEGSGFDFDSDKLIAMAKHAKNIGIDMLVMDDGWFGHRNCDDSSLGDWYVNENKLKGGLSKLISEVNKLGVKFGIWYEPEMISPESELYKKHPDWCVHVPKREKSIARQQYVIDMTRQDVRDNIFNQMCEVLDNNNIEYLKWDFNRSITEAGSAMLDEKHQLEFFHRFILGTYELMGRITSRYPDILFENCTGGGGRFDPGMLYYSPQIWCSDETDPIERLTIQFGTSMCYPPSSMGAHVSACDRTDWNTKADVALFGTFGYEFDPDKLSEDEIEILKSQVKEYHKYYNVIHFGELYRLISPTENLYRCAWENVSQDKTEMLYTCVTMRTPISQAFFQKFKGLDENKIYLNHSDNKLYSGALLMNAGLNFSNNYSGDDGTSFKIYFTEVNK